MASLLLLEVDGEPKILSLNGRIGEVVLALLFLRVSKESVRMLFLHNP